MAAEDDSNEERITMLEFDFGKIVSPHRPTLVIILTSSPTRADDLVARATAAILASHPSITASQFEKVNNSTDLVVWAALKADVKVIFAVNPNNKLKAFPLELLHNYHVCVLDHFCRVTKADFDHLAPPMPTTEFRDQLPEIFKNLGSSMVVVVPRDTAGSAEVFYWNTGGPASSAASAAGAAAPKPKRATKPDSGAAAHVSKTKHARPEERKASAPSKGSAAAAVSVPAAAAADRGLSTPCVVEAELGFSQDDARSRVRAEAHPRPPAASAAVSTTTAAATPAQTSAVPTAAASAASAASVASASTSAALAGAKRTATHALDSDDDGVIDLKSIRKTTLANPHKAARKKDGGSHAASLPRRSYALDSASEGDASSGASSESSGSRSDSDAGSDSGSDSGTGSGSEE